MALPVIIFRPFRAFVKRSVFTDATLSVEGDHHHPGSSEGSGFLGKDFHASGVDAARNEHYSRIAFAGIYLRIGTAQKAVQDISRRRSHHHFLDDGFARGTVWFGIRTDCTIWITIRGLRNDNWFWRGGLICGGRVLLEKGEKASPA
jgi:hypothetical protein